MRIINSTIEYIFNVIREELVTYGDVYLYGSAKNKIDYSNLHDIDIGLITDYTSEIFLKAKLVGVIRVYESMPIHIHKKIPLHFLIIGDFDLSLEYFKIDKIEHIIHFIPGKLRYYIWFSIILKKWKKYLLKRLFYLKAT